MRVRCKPPLLLHIVEGPSAEIGCHIALSSIVMQVLAFPHRKLSHIVPTKDLKKSVFTFSVENLECQVTLAVCGQYIFNILFRLCKIH